MSGCGRFLEPLAHFGPNGRTPACRRHAAPPADLDIQLAWTMLAVSVDERGLGDLLFNDKRRTDITSKQRDAIKELYSTWSVRRAERSFETDPQLASSILVNAGHEYPGDR